MHLFPTVLVYFAFAPAALVLSRGSVVAAPVGVLGRRSGSSTGALSAVAIELFADEQLRKYREPAASTPTAAPCAVGCGGILATPTTSARSCSGSRWSRSPCRAGFLSQHPALVLIGPIAMAIFFRFSCWLMDVRSLERRPDYQRVIDEVSAMVPWWPKRI